MSLGQLEVSLWTEISACVGESGLQSSSATVKNLEWFWSFSLMKDNLPSLPIHYTKNWTRSPEMFCQVNVKRNKAGTSYGYAVLGASSTPQSPFNCFRVVQSQRLNSLVNDLGGVRLWPWTPVTFVLLGLVPALFQIKLCLRFDRFQLNFLGNQGWTPILSLCPLDLPTPCDGWAFCDDAERSLWAFLLNEITNMHRCLCDCGTTPDLFIHYTPVYGRSPELFCQGNVKTIYSRFYLIFCELPSGSFVRGLRASLK